MGLGSTIGGVLGGVVGGVVGGLPTVGIGAGPGASLGFAAGSGIGGAIDSSAQRKKGEGMEVQTTSPLEASLLDSIRSRRKALDAGTMYSPQQAAIQQTGTSAMRAATRVAGGDAGATISALQKIQRGEGRSLNELYGQQANQSTNLLGAEGQLTGAIAQREFQMSQWEKSQMMYDAIQKEKDSKQIIAAVVAKQLAGKGIDVSTEEGQKMLLQGIQDYIDSRKAGAALESASVNGGLKE